MPTPTATSGELGYAAGLVPYWLQSGTYMVQDTDLTPELQFPRSVRIYDQMRKSDGQITSVLKAITLPMLGNRWTLNGDGVAPDVLAACQSEFGIGFTGDARARRRRQGITFVDHLREALLCLPFGFMPFEIVYEIAPPAEDVAAAGRAPAEFAHVRKLAARMPRTLLGITTSGDGGLAGIIQEPRQGFLPATLVGGGVLIPVERIVVYVNDKEGADWYGTSILRSAYKNWLIKDQLIRVDAQSIERNGMGVPVVTGPEGQESKGLAFARQFRAGATAGGYLADGFTAQLMGVSGSTHNALPSINYHDEAIGRSALAMFLNLGHDSGARSLGETFVHYFLLAMESVGGMIAETFTEHVIRDFVEINWGPDEPYPVLRAGRFDAEGAPTALALQLLASTGLITPDPALEESLRDRFDLPPKPEGEPAPSVVPNLPGTPFPATPAVPPPPSRPGPPQPGGTTPNPTDQGPPVLARAAQLAAQLAEIVKRAEAEQ